MLFVKVHEMITSCCLIVWTVPTTDIVNHSGFPLLPVIYLSQSSLHMPAVHYMICCRPSTFVWIHIYFMGCCFFILLHSDWYTTVNVSTWLMFRWLHWQHRGGQTGVYIVALSQCVILYMKCQSFDLSHIHSHCTVVFVQPWFAVIDKGRKMITKRSWKWWRIYSQPWVKMQWVTANFDHLLKMYEAVYTPEVQGFPTFRGFPVGLCEGDFVFTGTNWGKQQPRIDRYTQSIVRWKEWLVWVVWRHPQGVTWNTLQKSHHFVWLALLFRQD